MHNRSRLVPAAYHIAIIYYLYEILLRVIRSDLKSTCRYDFKKKHNSTVIYNRYIRVLRVFVAAIISKSRQSFFIADQKPLTSCNKSSRHTDVIRCISHVLVLDFKN